MYPLDQRPKGIWQKYVKTQIIKWVFHQERGIYTMIDHLDFNLYAFCDSFQGCTYIKNVKHFKLIKKNNFDKTPLRFLSVHYIDSI